MDAAYRLPEVAKQPHRPSLVAYAEGTQRPLPIEPEFLHECAWARSRLAFVVPGIVNFAQSKCILRVPLTGWVDWSPEPFRAVLYDACPDNFEVRLAIESAHLDAVERIRTAVWDRLLEQPEDLADVYERILDKQSGGLWVLGCTNGIVRAGYETPDGQVDWSTE